MSEEIATPESVSLYPSDRTIIHEAMQTAYTNSFSRALQYIIRDWKNHRQAQQNTDATKSSKENQNANH